MILKRSGTHPSTLAPPRRITGTRLKNIPVFPLMDLDTTFGLVRKQSQYAADHHTYSGDNERVSSDGRHVGDADQLFLDHRTEKVTHFLVSWDLPFQARKLIPANWVKSPSEEIHLLMPFAVLERSQKANCLVRLPGTGTEFLGGLVGNLHHDRSILWRYTGEFNGLLRRV